MPSDSIDSPDALDAGPRRGVRGWITESGLIVNKWTNWGKRRWYVNTLDGQQVGWLDLDTGERAVAITELEPAFAAALDEMELLEDRADYAPRRTVPEPVLDLADRRPGEHLRAHIDAAAQAGRELKPAVPGFEGRRAYSSWELGELGEQAVAEELQRLVALDPRWAFLNSIPVGTHKADIDHLVIGPGGVFTINTKHHHGADVWVADGAFGVNGSWKHYIEDIRKEAARAGALLTDAIGDDVSVSGLVVLVGVAKLTVKVQPSDVRVLDQSELVEYLAACPQLLDRESAARILDEARLSCTWK